MQITVQYAAQARQATGVSGETLEVPASCSVADLLLHLCRRHGEPLGRLLLAAGDAPQPALLLFVGDEQVRPDAARPLHPGDVVTILPPIAGGAPQGPARSALPGLTMTDAHRELTEEERATYQWQLWVPDFGEEGQKALKAVSVLVSRCGGVGGTAALYLAAAGVGRLVLAHAGAIAAPDLNRQVLMSHAGIGTSRVTSAARRLRELNPRVEVEAVPENVSADNVERLVRQADVIVDAAPLFRERFLLNAEAVRQHKPLVESAMYEMEAQLTTVVPGRTPCLACVTPVEPPGWRRQFPVFGAVAGTLGALTALEVIKVTYPPLGPPLLGRLLLCDLRALTFRTVRLARNPACPVCGGLS